VPYSLQNKRSVYSLQAMPDRSVQVTAFPAFLFDLDGTLVDSVYQHVLA